MTNTGIFIPVRLGATRLPNKPTAIIAGKPMMIWVGERAKAANMGDVIFACADKELVDLAKSNGYDAIHVEQKVATGTDCVHAASKLWQKKYDIIVNLQGDIPNVSSEVVEKTIADLKSNGADISTAAAAITNEQERSNPNVVKAIVSFKGRALYFTRTPFSPHGDGEHLHHIGIYAFRNEALDKFVSLPQTPLELRERLEQLRALENGMSISVALVSEPPHGVDTPEDLEYVRSRMGQQ